MEACKKNPSNHSFKYKLSFHASKEATHCSLLEHHGGHCWRGTGLGTRMHTQGTAPASSFKGELYGVDGWPGHGTGHLSCDTAGQAMGTSLLKSAVTPGECPVQSSASARKSKAEPDAFGHGRVCFLTGRLIGWNALATGLKRLH